MTPPASQEPIGAPVLPDVEDERTINCHADLQAPQVLVRLAEGSEVELVALEAKQTWLGLRERVRVRVRGQARAVAAFWGAVEDVLGGGPGWWDPSRWPWDLPWP